jgi:hypothetical protein
MLVVMLIYGVILGVGAKMIADGSEDLLEVHKKSTLATNATRTPNCSSAQQGSSSLSKETKKRTTTYTTQISPLRFHKTFRKLPHHKNTKQEQKTTANKCNSVWLTFF